MSHLLTPSELAEYLQVTEDVLRQWRKRGQGPAYVVLSSHQIRYTHAAVDAWLVGRTRETTP